jgi:two-component system sensor histidine kinase LytS
VAFVTIRFTLSPDRLRAIQTKRTLSLASRTLEYMRGGLSPNNCQDVCRILLPESQAMAVAMTNDEVVLGYAGEHAEDFPIGSPIHTAATHHVLASQKPEVFWSPDIVGDAAAPTRSKKQRRPARGGLFGHLFPGSADRVELEGALGSVIPAGIVAPLVVRGVSVGTLKLYYEAPHLIDETQQAIAEGLAELLSTQLSIAELDRQVELATKAELQALQSQINPHFLFNTINTIASLIRTDPSRARTLLREFAVFYRQTLENSSDLIPLDREIQQTNRYLGFEVARFGDERINVDIQVADGLGDLRVPSFIIQPIVENAVNHAMRPEGALHVGVTVESDGCDVLISVSDDGVGMTREQAQRLVEEAGPSEAGTGIALRNVDARLHAVFGPGSGVEVSSETGVGTVVTLHLCGALSTPSAAEV